MTKRIKVTPLSDFGQKMVEQNGYWWNTQPQNVRETGKAFQYFAISERTGVGRFLSPKDFKFKLPAPQMPEEIGFDLYDFLWPVIYMNAERFRGGVNPNQFSRYTENGHWYGELFVDVSDCEIVVEIPSLLSGNKVHMTAYDVYGDKILDEELPPHFQKIGVRQEHHDITEWLNYNIIAPSHGAIRLLFDVPAEDKEVIYAFSLQKINFRPTLAPTDIHSLYSDSRNWNYDKVAHFYAAADEVLTKIYPHAPTEIKEKIDRLDILERNKWHRYQLTGKNTRALLDQLFKRNHKPNKRQYF